MTSVAQRRTRPAAPAAPAWGPPPWQRQWGERVAHGLAQCLSAPAPTDFATLPPAAAWPVARGQPTVAVAALAALHAPRGPARQRAQALYEQCLGHYRDNLAGTAPDAAATDDLCAAMACFLAAALQALRGHATTPQRWMALRHWVLAWAGPQPGDDAVPLPQRQEALERLAILATALGEWSAQAPRQGSMGIRAVQVAASQWLNAELGVPASDLERAMVWQGIVPADNPSWGDTALPKHRTGQAG